MRAYVERLLSVPSGDGLQGYPWFHRIDMGIHHAIVAQYRCVDIPRPTRAGTNS